jgi:mRNA interferase YafQ
MKIFYKNAFEKDIKRDQKRGLDLNKLKEVMRILTNNEVLPQRYKDHVLLGNYAGHRE